jgi:hypothetical protein
MLAQKMRQVPDEKEAYTVRQTANEEGWKLQYDIYKHLTTLSTGSIILVVTFLEKLFKNPVWKGLVIASLVCLFLSIFGSFTVMNILASQIREMEADERYEKRHVTIIVTALVLFLLGIICLIIFASKNLFAGNLKPS